VTSAPGAAEPDDGRLASQLATQAGALLVDVRARMAGADPQQRKDAGDRESHEFLMAALAAARPGDAVLSEEGKDDARRLDADRVWIVDPVDGTREFSELDRDDWAVHVALWERGRLTAGAVALPAQGTTLATCDTLPLPPAAQGRPRLLVSRTRPPSWTGSLAEALGADLVPMGSAGAKAMAVLQGKAEVYVHAGGQYEWDSAAPVAVATSAGLHASRTDGSPLSYNHADPLLPDVLICRPELARRVLDVLETMQLA
jgi:3'(2'), 5'-bisphosphate nucleotidase